MRRTGFGWVALLWLSACATTPPPAPAPPPSAPRPVVREPARLLVDGSPAPLRSPPTEGVAPGELVLQGGHVLYIYSAALHPDGSLVAMLSVDMPDFGQEMTPATPYSTVTIVEPSTGLVRASWRIDTPDLQAVGSRVAFSPDGARLYVEGYEARAWDLRDGRERVLRYDDAAWMVPDPSAEMLVSAHDGDPISSRPLLGPAPSWAHELAGVSYPGSLTWSPDGARIAALGRELVLYDRAGVELARRPAEEGRVLFSPGGGALYARGVALDPRTLEPLGDTPWRGVVAISDDEEVLIGASERRLTLFDARTGDRIANIEGPDPSSEEMEVSRPATAFVPGTHRWWTCWYVAASVSVAPADFVPASARPDDWVDWVRCRAFDAEGRPMATHDLTSPIPFSRGAGPLSLREEGPELVVTEDEELVLALMQRVLVVSSEGRLVHALDDVGVEAFVTGALELPDGVALATPIALGVLRGGGAETVLCPGLIGGEPRLRVRGPTLYATRYACTAGQPPHGHDAILGVSHDGRTMVVGEGDLLMGEGHVVLVSGGRRRVLEGVEAWCQVDGCGPDAVFLPGNRRVRLERALFDARTGRLVRELDFHPSAFSPSGRVAGDAGGALVVRDLETGRTNRRGA